MQFFGHVRIDGATGQMTVTLQRCGRRHWIRNRGSAGCLLIEFGELPFLLPLWERWTVDAVLTQPYHAFSVSAQPPGHRRCRVSVIAACVRRLRAA
jgi:hypothetical protein